MHQEIRTDMTIVVIWTFVMICVTVIAQICYSVGEPKGGEEKGTGFLSMKNVHMVTLSDSEIRLHVILDRSELTAGEEAEILREVCYE